MTVLFVDVVGSTAIAEKLDPEEMHQVLDQAFELMLGEIHRYEGTVNQFLGDGLMALFGAPVAHEDHAVRAVHASLGIQRLLAEYAARLRAERGIEFKMRIGLNTGLVVVGAIGNDLRMDYTAIGDSTNLAARMQQHATPGSVLIAEPTYRLIGGYFETRPVGPLTVKGKSEPIQAYEVLGARHGRTRLDLAAERGLTPHIGRDLELGALSECFERVKAGQGQVVFVVGEPGIGKSRLLFEFRRRLGEEASWLEGHCMSFGKSIAFHPLIDLLKRNFGIEEGDTEETIVTKIERGVLLIDEDLRPTLRYLRYLLSVDPGDPEVLSMNPQLRRGELFEALRCLLLRAAELSPQVVVFEDLHWVDKATEESLRAIADSIARSRVLLILTYRPDYHHPFGERTYHTRIVPGNLSTEASIRMAQAMLATERIPDAVRSLIVRKAEGNPFFVEEVVESLREIGVLQRVDDGVVLAKELDEIVVPNTIQDLIMARIDRLEEAPKKTLQLASVIGREFTRRLLDRLADSREPTDEILTTLKAIELIHEKGVYPELAYMFKHALTHEVAYNSLLRERRKELHHLIAVAIEELYADRLPEQYELLCYHFSKAEEWGKALEYLLKAADKAARAFAIREALALYDQALEAAKHLGTVIPPATLMAIRQARFAHHFAVGEYDLSRAEAEHWLDLARQAGDRQSEANALASAGLATQWAEDFDGAREFTRQAIKVAEEIGNSSALARGRLTLGHIASVTAEFEEATRQLDGVLVISRSTGDLVHQALGLQYRALVPNWRGEYAQAASLLAEGVRISRENNLLHPLLRCLWAFGIVLTGQGDYDAAAAALREGLALSERIGDESSIPRYLNTLGWLHAECEDHEPALQLSERAAASASRRRHATSVERTAFVAVMKADVFMSKGELVLAREALGEARRIVEDSATHEWMKWRYTLHFHITEGEFWLAHGDLGRAEASADRGLDMATRTGSRKYVARAWRLKGEIATARQDWVAAEHALAEALAAARAVGNPPQLWKTYLALGRLQSALKKPDGVRDAYRRARETADGISAGLRNEALRASFENSPLIRQVYDLADATRE